MQIAALGWTTFREDERDVFLVGTFSLHCLLYLSYVISLLFHHFFCSLLILYRDGMGGGAIGEIDDHILACRGGLK